MRRLLRWTFNALAMASLLLCLATAGLWVRSYWVQDEFYADRVEASDPISEHYLCYVWSYRGRLNGVIGWSERPERRPIPQWKIHFNKWPEGFVMDAAVLGLVSGREVDDGYGFNVRTWALPHWSLVSAFAVLPAIFVFRQVRAVRRRRHRSRLGLCPACGYDLRASPGRCPECGRGADDKVTR